MAELGSYRSVKAKTLQSALESCRFAIYKEEANSLVEVADEVQMDGFECEIVLIEHAENIAETTKALYKEVKKCKELAMKIVEHQEAEKELKSAEKKLPGYRSSLNYAKNQLADENCTKPDYILRSQITSHENKIAELEAKIATLEETLRTLQSELTSAGIPPTD